MEFGQTLIKFEQIYIGGIPMQVPDRSDDLNRFYEEWDEADNEQEYMVQVPVTAYVDVEVFADSEREAVTEAVKEVGKGIDKNKLYYIEADEECAEIIDD